MINRNPYSQTEQCKKDDAIPCEYPKPIKLSHLSSPTAVPFELEPMSYLDFEVGNPGSVGSYQGCGVGVNVEVSLSNIMHSATLHYLSVESDLK